MLARLGIEGYALIDAVEIDLGRGLNVLTGETGAGKSIVVGALGLILGARASGETIRTGEERATIEGLFVDGDMERVIRRELHRDRSNRCYIDGGLATVRMLQEAGAELVDLHGQHEDQLLVRAAIQRRLLDAFAGVLPLAERVARASSALTALERERDELSAAAADRRARIDYVRAQVEELDQAAIEAGEEEVLEAEVVRLRNSDERRRLSGEVVETIDGDGPSLRAGWIEIQRRVDRLAGYDDRTAPWGERVRRIAYELDDLVREIASYRDGIADDPARRAEIEARIDLFHHLKRKHGARLEDVLERGRAFTHELAQLQKDDVRTNSLDHKRDEASATLAMHAAALSDARLQAVGRLQDAVCGRLTELGMGYGGFSVALSRTSDPDGLVWRGERYLCTSSGFETVTFMIAPNAGEDPRPLSSIASGGELSRVLLALKAVLAEADRTPTLVFDEIDAGIGGVVARQVADQLAAVARHHQVIVVTHLAQIAAVADRHLVVEKRVEGERTITEVRAVEGEDRVKEISRLLGGDPERDVSRSHAQALLAGRG